MRGLHVTVAALAVLVATAQGQRRPLTVYADVSLREALEALEPKFEAARPTVDVRLVFGGSGALADRIQKGSGADVFLSAGPRPVAQIATLVGRPRIFARNLLVVVTPQGKEDVARLPDLAKAERVLVPVLEDPAHAYARQLLERGAQAYGRGWLSLVDRHLNAELGDVRAVAAEVAEGKADAGIVYRTDAKAVDKLRTVPIPGGLNVTARYSAAAVRRSASPSAAEAFVEYLFTKAGQGELDRRGFDSPLAAPAELPVSLGNGSLRLMAGRLAALPQARLSVGGKTYRGVDLRAILSSATGTRVRFTGADGHSVDLALTALRTRGAVLMNQGDGNLQVILPSEPASRWVRWLRRIEVL